jgi:hypothetical protein
LVGVGEQSLLDGESDSDGSRGIGQGGLGAVADDLIEDAVMGSLHLEQVEASGRQFADSRRYHDADGRWNQRTRQ